MPTKSSTSSTLKRRQQNQARQAARVRKQRELATQGRPRVTGGATMFGATIGTALGTEVMIRLLEGRPSKRMQQFEQFLHRRIGPKVIGRPGQSLSYPGDHLPVRQQVVPVRGRTVSREVVVPTPPGGRPKGLTGGAGRAQAAARQAARWIRLFF